MNIVFWFLVIVALILIWFLLSSCFGDLGEMLMDLFNAAKEEMEEDSEENKEE